MRAGKTIGKTRAGDRDAGPRTERSWRLGRIGVAIRRGFGHYMFSSLTRRILILNFGAIAVLLVGILYINQFRDALIDAQAESLKIQGEIIAGAIAASATVDTDNIMIDPEKLLELQAGEVAAARPQELESLQFPINPERVAPLLRRLISPTKTRARVYDQDAMLVFDTRQLRQIMRYDLPPIEPKQVALWEQMRRWWLNLFTDTSLPIEREEPGGSGVAYDEVVSALQGGPPVTVRRRSERGEYIISVAVPIQRYRVVVGALQLSTQGDINRIIAEERRAILRVFAVAAAVTVMLSLLFASTIANPLRRLAAAAIRVRRGVHSREEIPDFSERQDEIGNLSIALRDMTRSLYARIDAIESFAADVSHELKNPLTSLGSAVETLPLAKDNASRGRLMEIIQHDVKRLDRLITDISDASRLDAELVRDEAEPVDVKRLVQHIVDAARDVGRSKKKVTFDLTIEEKHGHFYIVLGHDLRLGQVVTNLIENARSFVPEGHGRIAVHMAYQGNKRLIITIEDNGPGIKAEDIERIFERFYTDRPAGEAFGQNSGLGLSISRQIVEAHGGTLTAENIPAENGEEWAGARFIISLPAEA